MATRPCCSARICPKDLPEGELHPIRLRLVSALLFLGLLYGRSGSGGAIATNSTLVIPFSRADRRRKIARVQIPDHCGNGHRLTVGNVRIDQRELRNQSGAVLREVEAGRTIVVTRNGTPVGELRPIRRHRFVPRATIVDAAARAPRIDADRFRADLDAVINPHING